MFQNDTMRIIWAFHKAEPVGGAVGPKSLPQHGSGFRGTQSLYLVQRADQDIPGPEETARVWELRNPAVEPPAPGETLYWCRVFRIPAITRKHHLIRVCSLLRVFTHMFIQTLFAVSFKRSVNSLSECLTKETLSWVLFFRERAVMYFLVENGQLVTEAHLEIALVRE